MQIKETLYLKNANDSVNMNIGWN